MITSTVVRTHDPQQNNAGDLAAGICKYVRRERIPVSPVTSLLAGLPSLEAGQLSILSALAVIKGRKTLLS